MFAQRLKELRKLRGISQVALSSELGLSQQAVGKWETGRSTPDPAMLARIAAFFEVSTDYLLGRAQSAASTDGWQSFQRAGSFPAGRGKMGDRPLYAGPGHAGAHCRFL